MMIRRQFIPAGVEDYVEYDVDALGNGMPATYRVTPVSVGTDAVKTFAGAVMADYAMVQVKTAIGWSPLKTADRIDHVLRLVSAQLDGAA